MSKALNELKKATMASYLSKAGGRVRSGTKIGIDFENDAYRDLKTVNRHSEYNMDGKEKDPVIRAKAEKSMAVNTDHAKTFKRDAKNRIMGIARAGTKTLPGNAVAIPEDAHDAEGKSSRVAKTKRLKKKLVAEVSSGTLASYVSGAIADRKKLAGMADQAQRIHTPERAKYFIDKAAAKAAKRSKGIKTAVAKIAGSLPAVKVNEGNPERYADQSWARELADKSPNMSQGATKKAAGHYLMKGGKTLSGPHAPHEAVKAYKGLSDSKGVKIVHHTTEGVETDVTSMLMEGSDKYKNAAEKAVKLARAKKGNKHVDTEPKLNLPDKSTGGPMEGSHEGERNGQIS